MRVSLRTADLRDAAQLYRWRVDGDTVRNSIAPPPASLDEHGRWLERVLHDPAVGLYIARDDERCLDVGSVRIDRRGDAEVEMSITVDPEQRGRRYSHELIACGLQVAGDVRIVAQVKASNLRSLRAFRSLGFSGPDHGELVRLVHEPTRVSRGAGA